MLGIIYKHTVKDDGSVILTDYKYADDMLPDAVMCELADGKLVWYIEPDEFVRAVVEDEFIRIQSDWFLEYYGLRKVFTLPEISFEEWAVKHGTE